MFQSLHIFRFIIILALLDIFFSCTGSKRYFKAAEKLEKQGLVNEAAEFYLESLKRNYKNTQARIKLKEVGQKYVDFLSSQFFREFSTNDYNSAIQTFEKILDFKERSSALGVELSYPTAYKDDYETAIDNYVEENYNKGLTIFKQKKYKEALPYFEKVKKYRPEYKKLQTYYITAAF
jgi:tetratricopeptide (TPR) repeat protein